MCLNLDTLRDRITDCRDRREDGVCTVCYWHWHVKDNKDTWYSADGRAANQIDYVLISSRFRNAITDIRAQLTKGKF
jgi:hypothetical protein